MAPFYSLLGVKISHYIQPSNLSSDLANLLYATQLTLTKIILETLKNEVKNVWLPRGKLASTRLRFLCVSSFKIVRCRDDVKNTYLRLYKGYFGQNKECDTVWLSLLKNC